MEFSWLKSSHARPGLACLHFLPQQIILSYCVTSSELQPQLRILDIVNLEAKAPIQAALKQLSQKHDLRNTPCSWLLASTDYQLLLLDKPTVPASEINAALRWQLKKLISFSPEAAAINYFDLPIINPGTDPSKIFVTVAEKKSLQKMAETIQSCGFNLRVIDIPELALRNINALYPDNECYLGCFLTQGNKARLIITHQKNLLLTRTLNYNNQTITDPYSAEVALEIQRSFTYCQNQQQQALPKKLLISCEQTAFTPLLASHLDFEVTTLDIAEKLITSIALAQPLPISQLMTIGGSLRTEEPAHAAN